MNIIDTLSRYKIVAEAIVIGALAGGVIWGVHEFLEHERDIGRNEVQLRWDSQKASDKVASENIEKNWREKYDAAINLGAANVQIARSAATAANASADSLRNTNASIIKLLPEASAETARNYAAAYQAIFSDCVGRYQAMGEAAQGHANDAATLSAAFPTSKQ